MKTIWVFHGNDGSFPAGLFSTEELAESWIAMHRLSGLLTCYPVDMGLYDWAVSVGRIRPLDPEDPNPEYVANFNTDGFGHEHYRDGVKLG